MTFHDTGGHAPPYALQPGTLEAIRRDLGAPMGGKPDTDGPAPDDAVGPRPRPCGTRDATFALLESAHDDLQRLGRAVEGLAAYSLADVTAGARYAGAIQVLSEVIEERVSRAFDLADDLRTLIEGGARG